MFHVKLNRKNLSGPTRAVGAGLLAISSLVAPAGAASNDSIALMMSATPPVSIASCRQDVWFIQPTFGGLSLADASQNVRFVNRANVVATDVDFRVTLNGEAQTVSDHGTFSPGVTIDRSFRAPSAVTYRPSPDSCTVLAVRYADGSSWKRPDGSTVVGSK